MRTRYVGLVAVLCAAIIATAAGCTSSQGPRGSGEGLHSTVPDVSGLAQPAAEAKLEAAGYVAQVTTETAESAPEGAVVKQDPAAGTAVSRGGKVTIVVAAPAPSARAVVPDAVGFTISQVRMLVDDAGLVADIQQFEGDPNDVKVTRQDPAAGTEVEAGSTVKVWAE